MHEIRVKAEDEIERILLEHHASPETSLDTDRLRHAMDLAIAATIVENKIKVRGSSVSASSVP
ncbi:hypothetical protein P7D22_08585 [Lichenihabitans sp. Uapishka_5]|uniref:hypothetical protein n=1 Tax=Lichenihabitans sp. Uapishka_5 TaxID=3037302 RepID=UPI0029E7D749|nr:hypothetical protein [Lichenihabitans sp. Uapishka_5]MDX7951232.1 hypothetical protein [Lichenihabitans sp. Uapishka_5]